MPQMKPFSHSILHWSTQIFLPLHGTRCDSDRLGTEATDVVLDAQLCVDGGQESFFQQSKCSPCLMTQSNLPARHCYIGEKRCGYSVTLSHLRWQAAPSCLPCDNTPQSGVPCKPKSLAALHKIMCFKTMYVAPKYSIMAMWWMLCTCGCQIAAGLSVPVPIPPPWKTFRHTAVSAQKLVTYISPSLSVIKYPFMQLGQWWANIVTKALNDNKMMCTIVLLKASCSTTGLPCLTAIFSAVTME